MGERTWPQLLATLLRGEELSTSDTEWAMGEVMAGEATPAQIASFVIALRAKGETSAEISGMASAMLAAATRVHSALATDAVDIVGTGGDRAHTVNISTMAAITVAGTGVRVVKHGNRAASSLCGTADLLEHLGIPLDLGADDVARCVKQAGIAFCFAARFHPGMRHAGGPRREMGVPTAFNFLGPLTNPAQPRAGAIGCADERMAGIMADVFAARVVGDPGQPCSTLVLRGLDGLDEFTTTAPTRIWVVAEGEVRPVVIDAADLGIPRAEPAALRGGDVAVNADIARRFLAGERGPVRDAVLVNAAAGLVAYDGLTQSTDHPAALVAGIERAGKAIDSGAAAAALDRWIAVANA